MLPWGVFSPVGQKNAKPRIRAGVDTMEVEIASGHILGAGSIWQAMAETNVYAAGTTCDSNSVLALRFMFASLRRSQGRALLRMLRKSTTNVQRKYDLAQLEVKIVGEVVVTLERSHVAVNTFSVCCLLPPCRNEKCQVVRVLDCPMTWHPRCLFAMV